MRASRRGRSRATRKANAMLDLYSVKTQIDSMVADERRVQEDFRAKLELALAQYRRWLPEWERLARKIDESRTSWLLPGLSEGLGGGIDPPDRPSTISIAATGWLANFPRPPRDFGLFSDQYRLHPAALRHWREAADEQQAEALLPRGGNLRGMGRGADLRQSRARRFQARPDGVYRIGRFGLGSPR